MNGYSTRKHPPHGKPRPTGTNMGFPKPLPPPQPVPPARPNWAYLWACGIVTADEARAAIAQEEAEAVRIADRIPRRTYTLAPVVPYWLRYLAIGLLFVTVAKLLTLCAPL